MKYKISTSKPNFTSKNVMKKIALITNMNFNNPSMIKGKSSELIGAKLFEKNI